MEIRDLVNAVKPIDAYWWKEHSLTVVQDGYLIDGTRVHVVREKLEKEPVVLGNAIVISEGLFRSSSLSQKENQSSEEVCR